MDHDGKTGLFKTLWVIHSGEIYGFVGKLIVDAVGILFIIICITGLIWFLVPYFLRRMKEASKSRLKRFNRGSLRWHNWLGSWFLPLLILTTLTGMFLRPPLLIPIAASRVAKIKFSELDSPNPWFDRFRDVIYDREKGLFLVATSEGIYYSADRFGSRLKPFSVQPPVSVMGINVFEVIEPGRYRVGSFSGIFDWNPETGNITDCFTGMAFVDHGQRGAPFGNLTVAGYLKNRSGQEYIFDYAAGAIGLKSAPPFSEMPAGVAETSPISLWNASLEVHTGRIFEPLLGKLYILVVPVTGIFTFFILLTGFFSWWLARRKKVTR
jgi:4-amino-4-deoxy-L-arabinose transferase-like glycosyltransferase